MKRTTATSHGARLSDGCRIVDCEERGCVGCEAEFAEADLRGVPGHLVRRDPETKALVTREQAMRGVWRAIDLSGTHWGVTLELLARDGQVGSEVLVASRRARNFRALLDGLKHLRDAGVAEPT